MSNAVLVLCPSDPHWVVAEITGLVEKLRSTGFINKALDGQNHFLAGDRFLDYIAFMGCSPDIKLEPDNNGKPFSAVHLRQSEFIEFNRGTHTATPRCNNCGSPVHDWETGINAWLDSGGSLLMKCGSCQQQAVPWQYNWRRSAGFGRCFIEISNIYPKEAIPQQHFLDELHAFSKVNWQYFYRY